MRKRGAGIQVETRSSKYTVEDTSSAFGSVRAAGEDCFKTARRAAKYAVGVKSAFSSRRVSSMEESTMLVCI